MSVEKFSSRHIGPRDSELPEMLGKIGVKSLDELIDKTVPSSIRLEKSIDLPESLTENEYFKYIKRIAAKNKVYKSYIGMGYYGTVFPAVIQRNILENPGWYTSYTPYQAEISQGRLEALLNFQTVIIELTGMEIANASLLDEATAAAEAMTMIYGLRTREAVKNEYNRFFVDENVFPQTLEVLKTRAKPLGIEVITGNYNSVNWEPSIFGAFVQYPAADGLLMDYKEFTQTAHTNGTLVAVAADIMSLVLLTPPGEWGADVVVGSAQRFGIPMGYGGPHAAFFATRDEFKRSIPGRIIGVSIDSQGNRALRMALQTREQHIKRERATSNICTAQALLAIMAGMYAVYHGAEGIKNIATHIHLLAARLNEKLLELGYKQENNDFFDTLKVVLPENVTCRDIEILALERQINLRYIDDKTIGISTDESTTLDDLNRLIEVFSFANKKPVKSLDSIEGPVSFGKLFSRKSTFLTHELFNLYSSETAMMRYIKMLERKDFSLTHSMIPLGSCTMKLNAATELLPLSWPEFGEIHPFVPFDQAEGYQQLFYELGKFLRKITGFEEVSFQPNSGAAGEYAGLMVIRKYHESRGDSHRDVVLIPSSAHGTNPASAVMAGMKVVVVKCDENGNVDLNDLKAKAENQKPFLAAFMITYPSTHGVFESKIKEMAEIVHTNGGQVYMDGANMNAQVGLTSPAVIGADVCHINLHKTFGIPHGGGGPGMGPIAVAGHLVEFLPSHPVIPTGGIKGAGAVSAAPWGSASILTISHAYCWMLGAEGLTKATKTAILNANYLAACLKDYYKVLYKGENGFVAHEMILDCREFKQLADISEADIAKRLMDYGFHAPTLSFPVHGTIMVEPTESEPKQELDRFVEAMVSIYKEIVQVKEAGNRDNNILKNAPHTEMAVTADEWNYPYSRKQAAFPLKWVEDNKFWPSVARVDDAYGDRNLVCSCLPVGEYDEHSTEEG
ncbi:MAG: aminomethyl-transferring glycine dehydrogenase [Bacteroidales bacterium]|nr:aminomethyl-transferring glycine dehydrogenase [Bacteroidales bacterium]